MLQHALDNGRIAISCSIHHPSHHLRHVCHASKKYHFPLLVNSARHGRAICWSHAFERHPYPLSFNVVKPIFLALAELECPHVRELLAVRGFGGHAHLGKAATDINLIILHLGNGASMACIKRGVCVDTTMGLTPLEGLVMGTRSGDVDPGLIFYLWRTAGMSVEDIEAMLTLSDDIIADNLARLPLKDLARLAKLSALAHARVVPVGQPIPNPPMPEKPAASPARLPPVAETPSSCFWTSRRH